ncbi:hypothetical protein [Pedobacter rhodius]|uniref:Uncharacterized protein n=1 Tax=Pedobacter rhodius TaxID=3004098 RepID=A0ABT4KUF3_9SPHI|nr:hypothetical protein [Pedobacter sp. SJ11]MCZ4222555.1 hypothetical protein [Pedobacter sp. SJ11]
MYNQNDFLRLRSELLFKYGTTKVKPEDCNKISIAIFLEGGNYISERSIKRFLGLIPDADNLPTVVLDMLSSYVGHVNWETFILKHIEDDGIAH